MCDSDGHDDSDSDSVLNEHAQDSSDSEWEHIVSNSGFTSNPHPKTDVDLQPLPALPQQPIAPPGEFLLRRGVRHVVTSWPTSSAPHFRDNDIRDPPKHNTYPLDVSHIKFRL